MNSVLATLIKNLLLIILLADNLLFVFTNFIGYKEIKYHLAVLGGLFLIASCYEAYKLSDLKSNTKKFIYFTDGFLAKRFIKIIALICSGVVLYVSGSIIKYMAYLFFIIALTDVIVTIWRYIKDLSFVAFEEDAVIVTTNKLEFMRAIEIDKIETRHGLTYFVNKQQKAFTIRTDKMKDKEEFNTALQSWIQNNNLSDRFIAG